MQSFGVTMEKSMGKQIEITDLTIPELEIYAGATEVQLLRYYEPNPGIFIAESPNVIERALDSGYLYRRKRSVRADHRFSSDQGHPLCDEKENSESDRENL